MIYQDMNFAPFFRPIRRIVARIASTQRGSTRLAVYGLPFPLNMLFATIETQHRTKNLRPDAFLLPALKAFMQYAARNAKPGCGNRFSLTASPQNKPETVQTARLVFLFRPGPGLRFCLGRCCFAMRHTDRGTSR